MKALVHPSSLPRVRPRTRRNRAPEKVMRPATSRRLLPGSLTFTMRVRETARVAIPMGRLTKKIHRHPRPLVRAPPTSGPTATAPPTVAPQAAMAVPRSAAVEVLADESQRGGEHGRAAHALDGPPDDQEGGRVGQTADERGQREDGQSGDEDPLASEPVGQCSLGQDQSGQGQGVGRDHPFEVGETGVELPLHGRQGHLDDGDVHQEHEGGAADGDQGPPAAGQAPGRLRAGIGSGGRRRHRLPMGFDPSHRLGQGSV